MKMANGLFTHIPSDPNMEKFEPRVHQPEGKVEGAHPGNAKNATPHHVAHGTTTAEQDLQSGLRTAGFYDPTKKYLKNGQEDGNLGRSSTIAYNEFMQANGLVGVKGPGLHDKLEKMFGNTANPATQKFISALEKVSNDGTMAKLNAHFGSKPVPQMAGTEQKSAEQVRNTANIGTVPFRAAGQAPITARGGSTLTQEQLANAKINALILYNPELQKLPPDVKADTFLVLKKEYEAGTTGKTLPLADLVKESPTLMKNLHTLPVKALESAAVSANQTGLDTIKTAPAMAPPPVVVHPHHQVAPASLA